MKWWKNEILEQYLAFDTETEMIERPSHVPKLVITSVHDGINTFLIKNQDLSSFLKLHANHCFIMQNAPFDLAVCSKFLGNRDFYTLAEEDRLWDTKIMYALVKLATTGVSPQKTSLKVLAQEYLDLDLDKNAEVRCNFGQFLNEDSTVNYESISAEFLEYSAKDAIVTFDVWKKLNQAIQSLEKEQHVQGTGLSHKIQLLGAIALDDIHKNGIGFNLAGKAVKLEALENEIQSHKEYLASRGWVRGKKGIKKIFADIIKEEGIDLPKTPSGQISADSDTLAKFAEKSTFIQNYVKFHELEKLQSFISDIDNDRVHPYYNLLMNTGRTSCKNPNIQQLPRSGGIRELFVPSEGNLFLDIDYNSLEVRTLAQHLLREFGDKTLAEDLNKGVDPHIVTASLIYRIPHNEVKKDQRQFAKIANFGLPANMSAATFTEYAKNYGVNLSLEDAISLKTVYTNSIPSMKKFWNIGNKLDHILHTGRIRANCSYTAYLNTSFQGLAADGAKLALYLLWKEGFKIVAFIHDQVLLEVPEHKAEELLPIAEKLLVQGMKIVVPDILITVEGKITDKFTK